MTNKIIYSLLSAFTFFTFSACDDVKEKTKETLDKSGEKIEKTASDIFDGVGNSKSPDLTINLSENLKNKGLQTGKYYIGGSKIGNKNKISIYFIFDKDFDKTVLLKAKDKNGLEMGRIKQEIKGKAGETGYIDFELDKRVDIERRSIIEIE